MASNNAYTNKGAIPSTGSKLTSSLTGSVKPYAPQGAGKPKASALDSFYNNTVGKVNQGITNTVNKGVDSVMNASANSPAGKVLNWAVKPYATNNASFTPLPKSTTPIAKPTPFKGVEDTGYGSTKQPYTPGVFTTGILPSKPATPAPQQAAPQPTASKLATAAPVVQKPTTPQATPAPVVTPTLKLINQVGSMGYDVANNLPAGTSSQANFKAQERQSTAYPSLVGALANQQNSPYNQMTGEYIKSLGETAKGNEGYAKRAKDIADEAGRQIAYIGDQGARGEAGHLSKGTSPVAQGMAGLISRTAAAQQQAVTSGANMQLAGNAQGLTAQGQQQSGLTSAAGQSLAGQGQAQSALTSAAGLAAPDANTAYYGDPLSGGLYGGAGNAGQTGYTGNALIDGSVDKAIEAYKAGTPITQAAQLVVGDEIGKQAFLQRVRAASGGTTPNIAALDASAGQNIEFGQQTQAQSQALNLGLAQLDKVKPLVVDFISKSGLNSTDNPLFNKPINEYIANFGNTENAQKAAALMGEIKAFASQIIAAKSAGTPTSNDEYIAMNDPSLLTATQLQGVLDTWDSLGQLQKGVLDTQSRNAYNTGGGYTGEPARPVTSISQGQANTGYGTGVTNQAQQGLAGAGIQAGQAIGGLPAAVAGGAALLLKLFKK